MNQKKIRGIVIGDTNYSETSKILKVLTKDHGIISVMSKGCRRLKSSLRSASSKLVYADFNVCYKENGISTLTSVDIVSNFDNIKLDIKKISYASFLTELTTQVYNQNNDTGLFDLFISALLKIEEGFDPLIITNIIELKYLEYLGVKPSIDCCSICGSTSEIITLNSTSGGYICTKCYNNEELVSKKTITVIRMFYYVDIDKISKLELHDDTIKEINSFLDAYYDEYTGLYLKSKQFLKNLGKIGV